MPRKKQHGGIRPKSGRKPIEDKKVPVTVYIKRSRIEDHGGMEATKEKILNAVE